MVEHYKEYRDGAQAIDLRAVPIAVWGRDGCDAGAELHERVPVGAEYQRTAEPISSRGASVTVGASSVNWMISAI